MYITKILPFRRVEAIYSVMVIPHEILGIDVKSIRSNYSEVKTQKF